MSRKKCFPRAFSPEFCISLPLSLSGGARAHPAGGAPSEGAADAAGGSGTGTAAGQGRGGSHQSPTGSGSASGSAFFLWMGLHGWIC